MDRARQYIEQVGSTWVIPSAGPPCFLDDELRFLNDVYGDPANVFPDQMVFLEQMRLHGHDKGLLMMPGTAATFDGSELLSHEHPFHRRGGGHLHHRQGRVHRGLRPARRASVIAAEKAGWAPAEATLLEPLQGLFEPIMAQTDLICDGIGYPVGITMGDETVVLDFPKRIVREPISDEKFRYSFTIPPELVRTAVRDHEPDWVNSIFLSTRFRARRVAGYNEFLYTFFKCLTDERIAYADGWFSGGRTTTPPRSRWAVTKSNAAART